LTNQVKIRKISKDELPLIRDFPPQDWNLDLEKEYNKHYNQDYFYPIVATIDSNIIGTGIAVVNDNVIWLGIIIVKENYRNKGIGKALTNHLINYSENKGIDTIILAATDSGLPVYKKLGFQHDLNYLFFKSNTPFNIGPTSNNISQINKRDYHRIFELDYSISGEKRNNLLTTSIKT